MYYVSNCILSPLGTTKEKKKKSIRFHFQISEKNTVLGSSEVFLSERGRWDDVWLSDLF